MVVLYSGMFILCVLEVIVRLCVRVFGKGGTVREFEIEVEVEVEVARVKSKVLFEGSSAIQFVSLDKNRVLD